MAAGSLTGSRLPANRIVCRAGRPAPSASAGLGLRRTGRSEHGRVDAEGQQRDRSLRPPFQDRGEGRGRPGRDEVRATERDPDRPSPTPSEGRPVADVRDPRELAAEDRHDDRPSDEPSGDGRDRAGLIGPQRVDEIERPATVTTQHRPDPAREHARPPGRARSRPEAERRHPGAPHAVWRPRRRMAQGDDLAVVNGGDPLDEVDDRRHPRLVTLHDEARRHDRHPQPPAERGLSHRDPARGRRPERAGARPGTRRPTGRGGSTPRSGRPRPSTGRSRTGRRP